ncbi:MAG: hypothetical protein ACREJM_15865, partial [Candidatus Saccharimonadales bacterium]
LFTWALFGLGLRRPVALLCGLAPAVHPALGCWCISALLAALVCDWRSERERAAAMSRWFAAGAAVTAVSFAVQQYLARNVPQSDPLLARQLLEAFVADWDNHRFAFPLEHIEWRLGWCSLALFAVARAWFAACLPRRSLALLNVLLISGLASLAMCLLTHFSAWVPTPVMMAMPGRFINLAVVAFPAVLIGILSSGWRTWPVQGLLAGLLLFDGLRSLTLLKKLIYVPAAPKVFLASGLILIFLIAATASTGRAWLKRLARVGAAVGLALTAFLERRDWHLAVLLLAAALLLWMMRRWLDRPAWPSAQVGLRAIALMCLASVAALMVDAYLLAGLAVAAACWNWQAEPRMLARWLPSPPCRQAVRWAACLLAVALIGGQLAGRARQGLESLRGWDNDPVFAAASRTPGLLLTGPRMGLAQLRSRRGLVLYGQALNQITYVPASGPAINRVLKGIYDDDMLKPRPPGWVKCGGIMHDSGRGVWEKRQPDEWRQLSREFGFSAILTYYDWRLKLPIIARTKDLVLYQAPEVVSTASRTEPR